MNPKQKPDPVLVQLDGMIESTEEFIADDELTVHNDPEGRITDLVALVRVRNLYTEVFQLEEEVD